MHSHDFNAFMPMFWGLFVLCVIIAPAILRHQARMKTMDMMRRLLESGVTPPPEMLEVLKQPRMPRSAQHDLRVGVILMAVAGAMAVLAAVLQFNGMGPRGIHPLFAVAFFPGMVGVAMIALWYFNPRRNDP